MDEKRNIQFGLLCGERSLSIWQETVVKKLMVESDVELILAVFENKPEGTTVSSKDGVSKGGFLWKLYDKYWVKKKSRALKQSETKVLFDNIPEIRCNYIEIDGLTQLEAADITKIERIELDFLLDFASVRFSGPILKAAKYGIWSYRFGDLGNYAGHAPCLEINYKNFHTSAYLIRLTDDLDKVTVLREGHLKTHILYEKNIDNIHFEVADWPLKICHDIRTYQAVNFTIANNTRLDGPIAAPNNLQLFNFFGLQLRLVVKEAYNLIFFTDYWNIGIAFSPIHEFLNSDTTPSIKWFPNLSKNHFMADPFGIYFRNELHILCEDLHFDVGIGKTTSLLFDKGKFMENEIVIEEQFHMSYPFILEYEDKIYCIPETHQANQVRLYRATDFPRKWKLEKVLIEDYAGIDSTIFEYKDIWFLFSTNKSSGHRYNLNIHYSTSIFGPWRAHPKNPVKTDIRSARPAGTMFVHNGMIFRPSMDYSEKVEGRIVINKITTLNIDDFQEEVHNIVHPFKNTYFSDKVHTLSQVGPYTLVDGAKELFIFSNFSVFKYKLERVLDRLRNT